MRRRAKDTLTAVEMNRGEIEEFELVSGDVARIELVSTQARVLRTTLKQLKVEEDGARTDYCFNCILKVNGREHVLEREVSTRRSFYEPWEIQGMRIWLDAVQDLFEFKINDYGETILLDPWILFWQMYKDQEDGCDMQAYSSTPYCAPGPPKCCTDCAAYGVTCRNSFDRARTRVEHQA